MNKRKNTIDELSFKHNLVVFFITTFPEDFIKLFLNFGKSHKNLLSHEFVAVYPEPPLIIKDRKTGKVKAIRIADFLLILKHKQKDVYYGIVGEITFCKKPSERKLEQIKKFFDNRYKICNLYKYKTNQRYLMIISPQSFFNTLPNELKENPYVIHFDVNFVLKKAKTIIKQKIEELI